MAHVYKVLLHCLMKVYSRLVFIFLLLIAQLTNIKPVAAQSIDSISPIISRLMMTKKQVSQIACFDLTGLTIPSNKTYADNEKYLIKTEAGLYVGIEGTGLLYQIRASDDTIAFDRIDRTLYSGSNFCAAHFSYHNKIFSFGGYGFWKSNGAMRVFNPISKEWDIAPMLEEKPNLFCTHSSGIKWVQTDHIPNMEVLENVRSMPSLFWLDTNHGTLFTIGQRISNETIRKAHSFDPSIEVFDLSKGTWEKLGTLKRYGWNHYVALPQGLFIHESRSHSYVADLINNSILYPDAHLEKDLSKLNSGSEINVMYAIDSTIYFGNIRNNSIDSIQISQQHLLSKNEKLYELEIILPDKGYTKSFIIGFIIVTTILIFSTFRYNQKKDLTLQGQKPEINVTDSDLVFTEIEKSLILLLTERSRKGDTATVEDLNKILGVAAKPEHIKRKVRSEIIQSINFKWGFLGLPNEPLITSTRAAQDKRNREYFIREKQLDNPILADL